MLVAPQLPAGFEEAARLRDEVETELERICKSSVFRSSRRSCDFLRYVVRVALDGRVDSLKERSIGIDLLGRDSSYEPSNDATVRVRANEVRKRLASFYGSEAQLTYRIDLPIGSYVPRFLPTSEQPSTGKPLSEVDSIQQKQTVEPTPLFAPLSHLVLMRPAFFALMICLLLVRQQMENREDYLRFWDRILNGHSALFLSVSAEDQNRLAVGLYPLIWIAGRYDMSTAFNASPITGTASATFATVLVSSHSPSSWQTEPRVRWLLGAQGRDALTDRKASSMPASRPAERAALLTILPESSATLYVQGTDEDALCNLLEELTTPRKFPQGVMEPVASGRAVQILLRMDGTGHWTTEVWEAQP